MESDGEGPTLRLTSNPAADAVFAGFLALGGCILGVKGFNLRELVDRRTIHQSLFFS